jgi:hypothetical protein
MMPITGFEWFSFLNQSIRIVGRNVRREGR